MTKPSGLVVCEKAGECNHQCGHLDHGIAHKEMHGCTDFGTCSEIEGGNVSVICIPVAVGKEG